jgi:hypothetical protein
VPKYIYPSVQPVPSRSTVSDEVEGLLISIPAKRDWAILFLVFWLTFWTVAGTQSWRARINHFSLFMVVWVFGELWASYSILYTLGGKEAILANSETLRITKRIFGLGRSRTYLVREMQNLRFQRGLNRQPCRIVFDYGARTISFGAYIGEAEACELMSRIRQRCAIADSSLKQDSGIEYCER